MISNIQNKLKTCAIISSLVLIVFNGCSKDEPNDPGVEEPQKEFVSAVDISRYPEVMKYDPVFYDLNNNQKDFLDILKENGVKTIRLKLWVEPENQHASFSEVKEFSDILHQKGFDTWLTVHYSDNWADPGKQVAPTKWQNLDFETLKDSVSAYTSKVVQEMQPEYIQIGNEINPGFLHPKGHINNFTQFKALLEAGIKATRTTNADTKIMIHYAGIDGSYAFYNKIKDLDFDIIGLSYYPWWHGKSMDQLKATLNQLSSELDRDVIVAETAYPFTLGWNDWTNNIVGSEDQLILPDFPATKEGQAAFILELKEVVWEKVERGLGFSYWGGEQIAWKGNEGTEASPWENLALFDFNNKALPVLQVFKKE